jgi:hypothetical protein
MTPEMIAVRRRLYEDFAYYAENAVTIRIKDQNLTPLKLNRASGVSWRRSIGSSRRAASCA